MLNKQKGNMYSWCSHTWNPMPGECPHRCVYCYMKKWWPRIGSQRLNEKALTDYLGENRTIFMGSSSDPWAFLQADQWIPQVLRWCRQFPLNEYIFQSKCPGEFWKYLDQLPPHSLLGTTIETNRDLTDISKAPSTVNRISKIQNLKECFISIEPIMDFDLDIMVEWMKAPNLRFVSIGADSQGHKLPEPPADKILKLIEELKKFTEVKVKSNLSRLIQEHPERRGR